jgi:dTDP-4-dehydrorhamnose reductase
VNEAPGTHIDVLIFGGLGQVGEALVATAADAGRDPDTVLQLGRADVDIADPDAVAAVLVEHRPVAAINCAVFQPVDLCESEPAAAFAVNAIAVGALAQACRRCGTRLVHLSTDYVFGGGRRKPYSEEHLPAPRSVYGASKLAGEHLVLAASPTHMVVRTSAVYGTAREGHGTPPFIERMFERALAEMGTQVVTDQVVSPTYANDLAVGIWALLGCGGTGIFHVANRGEMSWFQLAEFVFDRAGTRRFLAPTTAAEYGAAAPRADYSALDNRRLRELGLTDLAPTRDALERYFAARDSGVSAP